MSDRTIVVNLSIGEFDPVPGLIRVVQPSMLPRWPLPELYRPFGDRDDCEVNALRYTCTVFAAIESQD